MVERRKQPTTASQYCVRGTDSLLYQREHLATRWDGALELGVNYMGNSPTVPFSPRLASNPVPFYTMLICHRLSCSDF